MRIPPGAPTLAELATLGEYFNTLWNDPSWLLRRVETVRLVDLERLERRITLDVDVDAVAAIAKAAGLPESDIVLVPLALLEKGLQLDLDVRSATGEALPLLTSEQDSRITAAAMAQTLQAGFSDSAGVDQVFLDKLYEVSRHMPPPEEIEQIRGAAPGPVASWGLPPGSAASIEKLWQDAFQKNQPFASMVSTFSVAYTPMTRLPANSSIQVVKFRYIGPGATPERNVGSALDLVPSVYGIPAPSVGRAAREHLRVVAPEGTFLTEAVIYNTAPVSSGVLGPSAGASTYDVRVSPERSVIYTSGIVRGGGEYSAGVTLRPILRGFGLPAFLTTVAAAVLIGAGAVTEHINRLLSAHADQAEPIIAIFGLLFSLYSIYLARPGEHALRSQLLLVPRIIILSTIAPVGFAAITFLFVDNILPAAVTLIWGIAALYCVIVAVYLGFTVARSRASGENVHQNSAITENRTLYTIIVPTWSYTATLPASPAVGIPKIP